MMLLTVRLSEVSGIDGGEFGDIELEVEGESEEACASKVLTDHGSLAETEVERTAQCDSFAFLAWCPSCVEEKARDRPHRRQDGCEKKLDLSVVRQQFTRRKR